jgi:hypothetical protein
MERSYAVAMTDLNHGKRAVEEQGRPSPTRRWAHRDSVGYGAAFRVVLMVWVARVRLGEWTGCR